MLPSGPVGKESTCNAGEVGLIPGWDHFLLQGILEILEISFPSTNVEAIFETRTSIETSTPKLLFPIHSYL